MAVCYFDRGLLSQSLWGISWKNTNFFFSFFLLIKPTAAARSKWKEIKISHFWQHMTKLRVKSELTFISFQGFLNFLSSKSCSWFPSVSSYFVNSFLKAENKLNVLLETLYTKYFGKSLLLFRFVLLFVVFPQHFSQFRVFVTGLQNIGQKWLYWAWHFVQIQIEICINSSQMLWPFNCKKLILTISHPKRSDFAPYIIWQLDRGCY